MISLTLGGLDYLFYFQKFPSDLFTSDLQIACVFLFI